MTESEEHNKTEAEKQIFFDIRCANRSGVTPCGETPEKGGTVVIAWRKEDRDPQG